MARFVLTAQLQLQAPTNTRQVVGQIRNQLGNQSVQVPVEVRGAAQAQRDIRNITQATNQASSAAQSLGRSFGLAVKRFAAFTVASRAVSLFTNSLASAVQEAIDFQREIVKVAQVLKVETAALNGLEQTITRLSTSLGVVSNDLLAVTRILSQAGVRGRDLEVALEGLAKSTLAPTFDDITQTAEGAVAVLAQFQKGVGALEGQLGSINAVAGRFAVESGDLIGAVRRFGGVFKSAGGELEELLAIFTSVRQTTRESAESISTGLRTIFTRIQRPETIRFLRQLGVELQDAEGRFIGPLEAVKRLGQAFSELEQGDLQFIKIAEELGGFRQIGKVIPLIQQYQVSLDALKVAQDGQDSLAADAAKAQEALAVQITKVKEEFLALVRSIASSTSFQLFTRTALNLATALIKVADAIKPLLPLIGGLAAIKFTKGLGGFFAGAGASVRGLGRSQGGRIQGFARGGFVPGSGNGDTVPAMLEPGEFVIKKSSAQKLGAGTLEAMNNNRFNRGGLVVKRLDDSQFAGLFARPQGEDSSGKPISIPGSPKGSEPKETLAITAAPRSFFIGNTDEKTFTDKADSILRQGINDIVTNLSIDEATARKADDNIIADIGVADIAGKIFEGVTRAAIGDFRKGSGPNQNFDIPKGLDDEKRLTLGTLFNSAPLPDINYDNKLTESRKNRESLLKKADRVKLLRDEIQLVRFSSQKTTKQLLALPKGEARNQALFRRRQEIQTAKTNLGGAGLDADTEKLINARLTTELQKLTKAIPSSFKPKAPITRASGGGVPGSSDTVPALLTPGEFVVNKKAAQNIGYGNLNAMNRSGVKRFAQGGAVGVQRFQGGGTVGIGFNPLTIAASAAFAQSALTELGDTSAEASDAMAGWSIAAERGLGAIVGLAAVGFAVKATLDWTKSLRESIKAQDEAKAAAQAAKEGNTDGTTDKQRRRAERDAKLSPRQQAANQRRREKVNLKKNAANLQKQFEEEDARRAGLETVQVPQQAKNRAEAEAKARQAEENKRNVATRDQSAFARDRAGSKLKGAEEARDFKVLEQEERSRRISALEQKKGVLTERQARGQAPGTVADPDRPGVALSSKDVNREIAELSDAYAKQSVVVDKLDAQVEKHTQEYVKQDDTNKKATKSLKDQGKAGLTAAQAQKNKTNADIQVTKAVNKETKAKQQLAGSTFRSERLAKKLTNAQARLSAIRGRENRFIARTSKQLKAATIQIKRLGLAAKRAGKSALAGARRGVAKVGGAAAGTLGAVAAIAVVGSQIAQGFEQWFKRAEELARKSDDIAGAIEAAGKASLAGSVGEAFTLAGFAEIAADSFDSYFGTNIGGGNGKQSFVERAFQKRETAEFEAAQSFINPRLQRTIDVIDDRGTEDQRSDALRGTIEAFASTRSELGDLTGNQREAALLQFNKSAREAIKSLDGAGLSIDELRSTAINLSGADNKLQEQLLLQVKAIENARKRQEELNKANLASLKITSAFGAANTAVERFAAGLQTGGSSLDGYIKTLEAAQSGVGVDASGAIDAIERQLVASAGGAGAGLLSADIQRQADVARAGTGFAAAAGGAVSTLDLRTNNPEVAAADLKKRLEDAIPEGTDDSIKGQLVDLIGANVDAIKPGELATTDISELISKISQDSQALSKGFFEAAKLQSAHNTNMSKLYQQREKLEAKAAEALNKAIDTQLAAAKEFEAFGGARLTGDQQLSARIAQFNNIGGLAGTGLRTGGAGDIRRVAQELSNTFNTQQQSFVQDIVNRSTGVGGAGIFSGAGGVQADQREEAKKANQALIQFTQQRIALLKEELSIVQAKNREEKNALDKLISGDIEGFIKGQAAAGAGAALRSGSAGLSSLFSASALGAGFKGLEGQGLSDQQLRRAEDLTLGAVGLQSTGVLSGTTAEEQAIKSEGRELAQTLGDVAAQAAQFEVSEIAIQDANIIAQRLVFQNELRDVATRNSNFVAPAPPVLNRWMGGPVYANRGMFVPRGTDTVPAMLTPGEFVVNRSAVQRGNNLQLLRAMNSGGGASGPGHKSGGGRVYYQTGGVVEGISSAFADSLPALREVFNGFSTAVDRLVNTQFNVKLDTTNVNVNLNGASFLASMKEDIKRELLDEVAREIGKAKPNSGGDMELRNTVL